jgi:hypothetical protein
VGSTSAGNTTVSAYEYTGARSNMANAQLQVSGSVDARITASLAVLIPPCPVVLSLYPPVISNWESKLAVYSREFFALASCVALPPGSPPRQPEWRTVSVSLGNLPDGPYTLRWSGMAPDSRSFPGIAFDVQTTFVARDGRLAGPPPIPTLSWPLLGVLGLALILFGKRLVFRSDS